MRSKPGHGKVLSYYEFGATSMFASRADQRFSYCQYVPESYEEEGCATYPLVVLIHGTERAAQAYRDRFSDFAERHQCIVLAPLFPCGIDEPGELDNYKFIKYRDIRFDFVLLAMIAEISERYRLSGERFLMHGFSGGGHFVHRFLYLHPRRLLAASIGAPGMVTLLDDTKPWWIGTSDLEQVFGKALDIEALRAVKVQMIVGAEDVETWEITARPGSPRWIPGANDCGRTRVDRIRALRDSFAGRGIDVRLDVVPGVAHEGHNKLLLDQVKDFFASALGATGRA